MSKGISDRTGGDVVSRLPGEAGAKPAFTRNPGSGDARHFLGKQFHL